ncbi:TniQ family protein [Chelatococcus asaccharovorans]|uniref:TniQ protein n=1 Tax=Chelatococcus asaccharovorans TaxID=28210 RepID=A0A2V3TRA1_9HYPH|nr:TniQ family protein [Chelatococcus asaccharovorans]MBS7707955.1 TniQ family protein [Chelatococcus asaccharovorans]MBS7708011.1 TniQ family protein [Chelatococcus asaccharovorans]PXW49942.1 TniQ protein [Chelatococcus asaccharovorans]
MATRLPIHPQPLPQEALSSWLWRLADAYDMGVDEFAEAALGITRPDIELADFWPSAALIQKLAERTGVAVGRIRAMTMAAYVPYLVDSLAPQGDIFPAYCCQFGIFENPALRVRPVQAAWWLPWLSEDLAGGKMIECVDCLRSDRQRFGRLYWRASWMASCPKHGVLLQAASPSKQSDYPVSREAAAELAALDGLTLQAVTKGRVQLPGGRIVHGGLWLRVLRGVIDEICRPRRMKDAARPIIEASWAAVGLPYRHALGRWGIYEKLGRLERANVLKVVAVAIQPLIRAGLEPIKALTRSLPVEAPCSAAFSRNFGIMPLQIENITVLARENRDVAIDLRRMLNHLPRSARFVAQTDETLESLGIPVLAPLLVARTPRRAGYPY